MKYDYDYNQKKQLLFLPSGEILDLIERDIFKLEEFLILNYDQKLESYTTDDIYRPMVTFVLKV